MKKLLLTFIVLSLTNLAFAQDGFNYKALVTQNGGPLANQTVTFKFTIYNSSMNAVYQEEHTTTTDANGIVSLNVGEGNDIFGDFSSIDWGGDAYILAVEIDSGNGYTPFGSQAFRYVPYAKYAEKAGNAGAQKINDLFDGKSDNDGSNNGSSVFLGLDAGMYDDQSDNRNVGIGFQSLRANTTGESNTAVGYASMYTNTDGWYNTALGNMALYSNNGGSNNTGLGYSALYYNVGGNNNTAVGFQALHYNAAHNNTAVGYKSMYFNEQGQNNVAIGHGAMHHKERGDNNVAVGYYAMYSDSIGSDNTAVGYYALVANQTGTQNTAVGYQALEWNIWGDFNTGVGYYATFTTDPGLNNTTFLGFGAGGVSNVDNRIEIGSTSVTWIGGQVTWSTFSDSRIKTDVQEDVVGLEFIKRLRPVTYHLDIHEQNRLIYRNGKGKDLSKFDWPSKYDIENIKMTGFIAQEVEQAAKEVGYDFSGVQKADDDLGMYSISYAQFVVPLVKAVQEQQEIIERQQREIERLKQQNERISQLEEQLRQLQQQVQNLSSGNNQ